MAKKKNTYFKVQVVKDACGRELCRVLCDSIEADKMPEFSTRTIDEGTVILDVWFSSYDEAEQFLLEKETAKK